MKKAMVTLLAIVLVLSLPMTVLAAGGFVSSPGANEYPFLIEGGVNDENCDGNIVVTPYSDRDQLDAADREDMEEARDEIEDAKNLTDLCDDLKDIAKDKGVKEKNLAVSDLFHIGMENCDDHNGHGDFDVTLKPSTANNFVALMKRVNGKWVLVKNAKVSGDHLLFTSDEFGAYAIVVNTAAGNVQPPLTGDAFPWLYVVLMVVSAAGLVTLFVVYKKKNA